MRTSLQIKVDWREKNIQTFGIDLSFSDVPESQRTKHVHRLHPYLGKFIPQLVETFLKKFFKPGQVILDPFAGSGTTLIEANLLNMPSVGIELNEFSFLIAKVKTQRLMPLSDRKAGATNYPLNKILKIRSAVVVCFISIFSLNNSDNLKGRANSKI
jgi:DNA modification methylase